MNNTQPERHEVFRILTQTLIDFAAGIAVKSAGRYQPTDVARMLLSSGIVMMANDIGRASTVHHLRDLATALEAGASPAEWN